MWVDAALAVVGALGGHCGDSWKWDMQRRIDDRRRRTSREWWRQMRASFFLLALPASGVALLIGAFPL